MTQTHARRRVAPLAPEDRRAALIAATLPLLIEHGTGVSTRQIAHAAGVAEGTIFRVFPDKSSLVVATLLTGLDPASTIGALDAITTTTVLRQRLIIATGILAERMRGIGRLHMIARELMLEHGSNSPFATCLRENRVRVIDALTRVIAPDRAGLRVPPATAARLLQAMIMAASGHLFGETEALSPHDVVTVLLDGLVDRPAVTANSVAVNPVTVNPVTVNPVTRPSAIPSATSREFPC